MFMLVCVCGVYKVKLDDDVWPLRSAAVSGNTKLKQNNNILHRNEKKITRRGLSCKFLSCPFRKKPFNLILSATFFCLFLNGPLLATASFVDNFRRKLLSNSFHEICLRILLTLVNLSKG